MPDRRRCRLCFRPQAPEDDADCSQCAQLLRLVLTDPAGVVSDLARGEGEDFVRGVVVAVAYVRRAWCP